ncbi:MAG: hypothetical protein QOC73_1209 [Actinomycetota bacterium]|jgi:hypothetical protein|nr:hypothetical protein [Actinomycetota bacterium]MDQ1495379.1 hypothetical protein [Actinomycetota bacterium]MDQ1540426.1 hypothetical protein [Actinomycetota bacterium]
MSRFTGARAVAIGIVATAVVLAGCSSKKSPAAAASTSAASSATSAAASAAGSPAASGSTTPLTGDPAMIALATQSLAALAKVKSVHMLGSIDEGGTVGTIDLTFANGKGSIGSIGIAGGTLKFLAIGGNVYIQADAKAFSGLGASAPPSALAAIAGKWINVGKSDGSGANAFGDFSSFADLSLFAKQFAGDGGKLSAAGNKTINGKPAIGILETTADPANSSTLYVAADGNHLPLEVVPVSSSASSGSTSDRIDFLNYDAPVTITAPTDAIDLAQLAQLMGVSPSPSS